MARPVEGCCPGWQAHGLRGVRQRLDSHFAKRGAARSRRAADMGPKNLAEDRGL